MSYQRADKMENDINRLQDIKIKILNVGMLNEDQLANIANYLNPKLTLISIHKGIDILITLGYDTSSMDPVSAMTYTYESVHDFMQYHWEIMKTVLSSDEINFIESDYKYLNMLYTVEIFKDHVIFLSKNF